MPGMTNTALSALVVAWTTTMIATTLFLVLLALSQFWDSGIFFQALREAMNCNV
jgi:hypothetical protein